MGFDPPIRTWATVGDIFSYRTYRLILPNGKETYGHLSEALKAAGVQFLVDETVTVEMTPYDFSKARIIGRVAPKKSPI